SSYCYLLVLHSIPTRRSSDLLNQIAQKAHVLGVIDERRYDEEMRKFDQLVRDITQAVILPRAMDTKGSPRSLLRGEKEHPRSGEDRKSTRLNSSHVSISYAVF